MTFCIVAVCSWLADEPFLSLPVVFAWLHVCVFGLATDGMLRLHWRSDVGDAGGGLDLMFDYFHSLPLIHTCTLSSHGFASELLYSTLFHLSRSSAPTSPGQQTRNRQKETLVTSRSQCNTRSVIAS